MTTENRSVAAKKVSDLIYQICVEAGKQIDEAIEKGEATPITKLAKNIAAQFSIKNYVEVYHILRLFVSMQDDIKAKQGPNGGIVKVLTISRPSITPTPLIVLSDLVQDNDEV